MSDLELLDLLVEQNRQVAEKLRLLEKSLFSRELGLRGKYKEKEVK